MSTETPKIFNAESLHGGGLERISDKNKSHTGIIDLHKTSPDIKSVVTPDNFQSEIANTGEEMKVAEIEYIETEYLDDVDDVDRTLKMLLAQPDSKDWVLACGALNNIRRLSIFHADVIRDILGEIIPLVVTSMKNPRSAVCKTAIMTSSDLFNAYMDRMIDFIDPLLMQLLLKSSQDKKFVCEAAQRALKVMTSSVSPVLLLPKLHPYLKNKNPRIRAKASMCFSRSAPRLDDDGIRSYGLEKLIEIAASQLSDRLPESREAARNLLLDLQAVYKKIYGHMPTTVPVNPEAIGSWEHFCRSKLTPLSAQAVLRVTGEDPEALVSEA